MVRDFDLIRKILLYAQSLPAGSGAYSVELPGEQEHSTVDEHVQLLIEAGLLKGKVLGGINGIAAIAVQGFTWAGHDFIDAAKDDTIWEKAKTSVLKPAAAVTFDALLQ